MLARFWVVCSFLGFFFPTVGFAGPLKPKLVLQLTIDQLRGDVPERFLSRLSRGGFRLLADRGIRYVSAHHRHADTETAPGHAVLVTGAYAPTHGLGVGRWWSASEKRSIYAVEQLDAPLLEPLGSGVIQGEPQDGRGPKHLLSTTIGDEIYFATDKRAKVFAVGGKDRSSVVPAGHTGKAFWFADGHILTSQHYFKKTPPWVQAFNQKDIASRYRNQSWNLVRKKKAYRRLAWDDRPFEGTVGPLGRTLPKSFATPDDGEFLKAIQCSFANDDLVLAFVRELIRVEELGQRDTTDYLSVSLSSTDYIGHIWGPDSLEAEDNVFRLDAHLQGLFQFIDRIVGLQNTLVVLSSDHGAMEPVEALAQDGVPASRLETKAFLAHVNANLRKAFGGKTDYVEAFIYPYLYLDEALIARRRLLLPSVEKRAADEAMTFPGIAYAFARSDILRGRMPDHFSFARQVQNTFHPARSGHVHLVAEPHRVLDDSESKFYGGSHRSVWTYDTHVPMMFLAEGFPARRISRQVGVESLAVTLASCLGTRAPSGATGRALSEVCAEH